MKKTILYTLFGLLALSSCTKDEEPIQPSGNYSVLRFDFPQGNHPYDDDIVKIKEIYDTYLIYKDITPQDLNRQWQGLGTGSLKACDPVDEENVAFYVDFMKDHVFSYMTPEAVRKAMPVKIYLVQNLRDVAADSDGSEDNSSSSSGTGSATDNSPVTVKTDGFDYWALSFTPEGLANRDEAGMRFARCKFLYVIIKACYLDGIIEEPLDIRNKITWYNTDGTYKALESDPRSPNYSWERGFPDRVVEKDFKEYFNHYITQWMREFNAYSVEYDWFLNYCRMAMFYGRDYIEKKYEEYPLVIDIYNDIVTLMQDRYGIDLEGIYQGPQGQTSETE